jgi:hypothetical protein
MEITVNVGKVCSNALEARVAKNAIQKILDEKGLSAKDLETLSNAGAEAVRQALRLLGAGQAVKNVFK